MQAFGTDAVYVSRASRGAGEEALYALAVDFGDEERAAFLFPGDALAGVRELPALLDNREWAVARVLGQLERRGRERLERDDLRACAQL